jgi:hypothetical protein
MPDKHVVMLAAGSRAWGDPPPLPPGQVAVHHAMTQLGELGLGGEPATLIKVSQVLAELATMAWDAAWRASAAAHAVTAAYVTDDPAQATQLARFITARTGPARVVTAGDAVGALLRYAMPPVPAEDPQQ